MNDFKSGMFTYEDLKKGKKTPDSEQSIAKDFIISNENTFDETQIEDQRVYRELEESGVSIEPFELFYADGAAPQNNKK